MQSRARARFAVLAGCFAALWLLWYALLALRGTGLSAPGSWATERRAEDQGIGLRELRDTGRQPVEDAARLLKSSTSSELASWHEALADNLCADLGWHFIDLGKWRHVDFSLQGLALVLRNPGTGPVDVEELHAQLRGVRSLRMRQVLLLALGWAAGPELSAPHELIAWLEIPDMRATAAYALGRSRDPAAVSRLRQEWERARSLSGDHHSEEALLFGWAQGAPLEEVVLLSELLSAEHEFEASQIRLGQSELSVLPLSLVRDPESFDALLEVAHSHPSPRLRAAAMMAAAAAAGLGRAEDRARATSALVEVAGNAGGAPAVRAAALGGLGPLVQREEGRALLGGLLAEGVLPKDVLEAALDLASWTGLDNRGVRTVIDHLEEINTQGGIEDAEHHERLLGALAAAGDPHGDQWLGEHLDLIGSADSSLRFRVVSALWARSQALRDGDPASALAPELLDRLADLARRGEWGKDTNEFDILALSAAHVEFARELAWDKIYSTRDQDEYRDALVEHLPALGPEGQTVALAEWRRSGEFLPRLELLAAFSDLEAGVRLPATEQFLIEEGLPELRKRILSETGVYLRGAVPGASNANLIAFQVSNLFGRYGSSEDVPLLEKLGPTFRERQGHWPPRVREPLAAGLDEAIGRAIDLINLRGGP